MNRDGLTPEQARAVTMARVADAERAAGPRPFTGGDAYFTHVADVLEAKRGRPRQYGRRQHRDVAALEATLRWIQKPKSPSAWLGYVLWAPYRWLVYDPKPIMGAGPWPKQNTTASTSASAGVGDYVLAFVGATIAASTASGTAYVVNGRSGSIAQTYTTSPFTTAWNYIVAQMELGGPVSTGASTAITNQSNVAGVSATFTVASAQQPYPRQRVTVAGYTGASAGYNGTYLVTDCTTTTFTVAITTSPTGGAGAPVWTYAASAGGQMTVVNLSTTNVNRRIGATGTLNSCDGLSIVASGTGKTGQATPFEDTGSTVIQAVAPFTSSTTIPGAGANWAINSSDGLVLFDGRGGSSTAATGGREDLSLYKVSFDGGGVGGAAVVDCCAILAGKGGGNAVILTGCKFTGAAATNVSVGSNTDTGASGDIYFIACMIAWNATSGGTKGGSPVALIAFYVGDTTIQYCNIASPQGNTCVGVYVAMNGRGHITDSHIGGSGNTSSRISIFGCANTIISRNYLDNDKSSTGCILVKPSGTTDANAGTCYDLHITDNYVNFNAGAVAMLGIDGSSSKNCDGLYFAQNFTTGVSSGGVGYVVFTGFSATDTRQIRITENHGKNVSNIYTGTPPGDTIIRRNGASAVSTGINGYQDTGTQIGAATGAITTVETLVNSYVWYPGWMNKADTLWILSHGIDTFAAGGATTQMLVSLGDGSIATNTTSVQALGGAISLAVAATASFAASGRLLVNSTAGLNVLLYSAKADATHFTVTNGGSGNTINGATGIVLQLTTITSITSTADIATGGTVFEATVTMRSQTALYGICEYRCAQGVNVAAQPSIFIDVTTGATTFSNTVTSYIVVSALRSAANGNVNFRDCLIAPASG